MVRTLRLHLLLATLLLGPVACAVGSEDVDPDKPTPKPVVSQGSGQTEQPVEDDGSWGGKSDDPEDGEPGAGGAGGNGDVGDEEPDPGFACGSETCVAGESCCNGSFCYPTQCTQCCSAGSGGGGSGGGGSGGSGGGSPPPPSGMCGGKCGSPLPQSAGCYCDVLCVVNMDCCPDFFLYCI